MKIINKVLFTLAISGLSMGATAQTTWNIGKDNPTDVTATLSADGKTLTINGTGTGVMKDFESWNMPWFDVRNNITSLVINEGITTIGNFAFFYCYGLTDSLIIPEGVTTIGDYAFHSCAHLTSLTIPESVTTIGNSAFYDCYGLTGSLTIPKNVTKIQGNAFFRLGSTAINVVEDNENYSSVDGILYNKDKTTLIQCPEGKIGNVSIPSSVITIGDNAFFWCYRLTGSLIIPEGVTTIGTDAFFSCSGFSGILTIPASVTTISENMCERSTFGACINLTAINVVEDNENYSSADGILYNKDKTILIQCPASKTGNVSIPQSVTTIGNWAFGTCRSLSSLVIPKGVTTIGDNAFNECFSLTSLEIPSSVTTIGNYAFQFCHGLASLTIPKSVITIGYRAFYECNGLTSVINYATIPQTIDSEAFLFVKLSDITLYVPAASLALYRSKDVWKEFKVVAMTEETNVSGVEIPEEGIKVVPETVSAHVVWRASENATGYTMVIYGDANHTNIICSLEFDATGRLLSIIFGLRSGVGASSEDVFGIKINNLSENTTYHYTMQILGENGVVLDTKEGSFKTTGGESAVNDVMASPAVIVGYYNIMGQKLPQEPERGIYIILYDNGTTEKRIRN